jgi:hypothetical protein
MIYKDISWGAGPDYGEFIIWREGIIGFRKKVEEGTIYGWARIEHGSINSYAFLKQSIYPNDSVANVEFMIFPNPNSKRILNLVINEYDSGSDYFIDILNSAGIQIKSYVVSEKIFQISIASLRRGFYYVRMRSPEKQTTQKLIVL